MKKLDYVTLGSDLLVIGSGIYITKPPATVGEYMLGAALFGVGVCLFYKDVMEL